MRGVDAKSTIYYRLIALWVLCEAMLGGIIHGFKIPVSGLVVGSAAVTCICLLGWYVPKKTMIIRATIIVAIFKMMLSPQAPPPAYIAVFFQGLLGELLFWKRKWFPVCCIILALLSLLESGLQRILVLTIVYGNDVWNAFNQFISRLTGSGQTNYSLIIGAVYVAVHIITGFLVGWWASTLPGKIEKWQRMYPLSMSWEKLGEIDTRPVDKKRKRRRIGFIIIWIILAGLYIQSYFNLGTPLLPSHISLKILLRSLIIIFTWILVLGPFLKILLHKWLEKKKTKSRADIREVLLLLPGMQSLVKESWKQSSANRGWRRLSKSIKMILGNALTEHGKSKRIIILSAPVQTGKTTALQQWTANRKDVHGILTPVINGKRRFMDVATGETFDMEASDGDHETLSIGRFVFSAAGFRKATEIISNAISKPGWVIIDEIGPLELNDKGFNKILQTLLAERDDNILLVIREKDSIIDKLREKYGLHNATVIGMPGLENI